MKDVSTRLTNMLLQLEQVQSILEQLRQENHSLKTEVMEKEKAIHQLTRKLEQTEGYLNRHLEASPESSKQLRQQIDLYISEIDKCMEWLQQAS